MVDLNRQTVQWVVAAALFVGFHVYVGFSIAHSVKGAVFPLIILVIFHLVWIYELFSYVFKKQKAQASDFMSHAIRRIVEWRVCGVPIVPIGVTLIVSIGFLTWIVLDSAGDYIRLRSLSAIFVYIFLGVCVSANPAKIKWRPVIGGFVLQIVVGLIVLKWSTGHEALRFASEKVVGFLDFTKVSTAFVYGLVADPPNICGFGTVFLFTALQIIIYFAAVVAILNYFGIIEFVLSKVATVMQYTIGTTAAESLNAAACIFLGQTEAAILIQPALATMTESEVHAVMTAGFACIAGSLFSAYISFGACPAYLLSATVMNAAVSLAVSKLIYPEIQVSRQKDRGAFKFKTTKGKSLLDLMSTAATHSAKLVLDIGANLIVYIALLAFFNSSVGYMGDRVGIADLSFNKLLGYAFYPLAYLMGASDASDSATASDETFKVAELMGMKTVLNEFIAYQRLAQMIHDGTLKGARAQMIATYALCGFSNISMIGSQLGILGSMCPWRKGIFAKVVIRALVAGCMSCFLTASVAGLLVSEPLSCKPSLNDNCFNITPYIGLNATSIL